MRKILTVAALLASAAFVQTVPAQAAETAAKGDVITVYVLPDDMGMIGPNGKHHDTMAPSTFVLHKGVPVTMRIVNYDDAMHSITSGPLGVSIMIKPGTDVKKGDTEAKNAPEEMKPENGVKPAVTTYTFTPSQVGQFRWNCVVPCDGKPDHWAMTKSFDGMGHDGYMAGYFFVE